MELCVVSCGRRKIWDTYKNAPERVPARAAYVGSLTRLAIKYAETFYPNSWIILSGKYGFLFPWEEIQNYDKKINRIDENFIKLLEDQVIEKKLYRYSKAIVLGGENYLRTCEKVFKKFSIEVSCPLRGLGIFSRIRLLSEAVRKHVKIEELCTGTIS